MISSLQQYDKTKNTGLPWLGSVPDSWQVLRNKYLWSEVNERSHDGREELLTVSQYTGVTRRRDILEQGDDMLTRAASLAGYKRASRGDLVMNIMLAWNGSLGVTPIDGIVSPAYCVFRLKVDAMPGFFHHLLRTPTFTGMFKMASTGVIESRLRLYPDVFFRTPALVPPRPDQESIVRFLDHLDTKIHRFLDQKRQLIARLNEQKQAMVSRIIACGVIPRARLKPLGSAPQTQVNADWPIRRLWSMGRLRTEKNRPDLPLLSVFLGRGVIPYGEGGGQVHKPSLDLSGYQVVHEGDLVLNNQQAWRGSVGVSSHRGIISPAYVVLALDDALSARYADYLFRSRVMVAQLVTASKGVGDIQRDVHMPWLRNILVPLPSGDEQAAIVAQLDHDLRDIERQLSLYEREMSLIREYHTRLATDVVTGRVDVRAAAAALPSASDKLSLTAVGAAEPESITEEDGFLAEETEA